MSEEKPKKKWLSGISEKLKKIKHLDIILTILFIAIILLIYFSTTGLFSTSDESNQNTNNSQSISSSEFDEYASSLAAKLEVVVSSIAGAGQTRVMLYFDSTIINDIAYSTETKTLPDGTVVQTKTPIMVTVDGKQTPVILKKTLPQPKSVVIVASGAKDTNVKIEILRLVQAMFELKSSNIEIFAGN